MPRDVVRTRQHDRAQAQHTAVSLDHILGRRHFLAVHFGEVARLAHRPKVSLHEKEGGVTEEDAEAPYEVVVVDLDVAALIEAGEGDRGDGANFELLVEETLEDELAEARRIGSGVEEVAEDHVLDELDGGTSSVPLGTGDDLRTKRRRMRDGGEMRREGHTSSSCSMRASSRG